MTTNPASANRIPLAERMRPTSLDEVVGQEAIIGEGKILTQIVKNGEPVNLIFWGPPGTGKTTLARILAHEFHADFVELSAVTAGKKDIEAVVERAKTNWNLKVRTVLFVDEIHRFNKAQQDAFLPHVESGLIILIPLAFSLAKRTGRSTLFYAVPLLAGLAVGHAFIPPTPGPVLVASMLGVDLGWVILIGIFCGTIAMIVAGPIWGSFCGKKYMIPVPERLSEQEDIDESKLPHFATIVGIIMIPLLFIICDSVCGVVLPADHFVSILFSFLGEPFVAMLIATIVAMLILGLRHGYTMEQLENLMTKSLEPTGLIMLVTACGGVLRYVLQYSGLGDLIGAAVSSMSLPLVVLAFLVAVLVRVSVGSSTVAMTMAAGIVSAIPGISELSPLYLACVTAAIAGGSTVLSHFNDSGFWLVKSLVGLDEKTTLKTWTIMETLVGFTGFLVALVISFFA